MNPSIDELLSKSCGQVCPISLLISSNSDQKVSKYVITKPYAVIGRHDNCDIVLAHQDVSSQHVYLQVLDGRLFCVDQGSRKWIFWKDKPRLYGWLDAGEWIQVGPYRITLEQPVGKSNCRAKGARSIKPFLTKYVSYNNTEAEFVLDDQQTMSLQSQMTTIGRSRYCNLELEEEEISRVHASIVRTVDGQFWLIDLMSRIGTKINGKRCVSALLNHNDIIQVGSYSILFRFVPKHDSSQVFLDPEPDQRISGAAAMATPRPSMAVSVHDSHRTLQPLQIQHDSITTGRLVVRDLADDSDAVIPVQQFSTSTQLVPKPATSLLKTKVSVIDPPHIKLSRPGSTYQELMPEEPPAQHFVPMDTMMQFMKQLQQEMMTQMRMNMEMMTEFMGNLQKQHMEVVREEIAQMGKLNKEILELRQNLVAAAPPAASAPEAARPASGQGASKAAGKSKTSSTPAFQTYGAKQSEKDTLPETSIEPEPSTQQESSHVWISKRIAVLEKERVSRWERLKSRVKGKK